MSTSFLVFNNDSIFYRALNSLCILGAFDIDIDDVYDFCSRNGFLKNIVADYLYLHFNSRYPDSVFDQLLSYF